jgi:hypothetical protein
MSTSITATSASNVTDRLFAKLDTKQKGYIDEADLQGAAGTGTADAGAAAELFKQLDSNTDGKVTKSELSVATEKVGDQLSAQLNQSQTSTAAGTHSSKAEAAHARRLSGGGSPPGKSGGSDSAAAAKYVTAADTNSDGTVSADEDATFKKLMAAAAEAKALAQAQEYKDNSSTPGASASGSVNISA